MNKLKKCLALILIVLIIMPNLAYAWSPVTHYHINKAAHPGLFSSQEENLIFYANGMGPDLICRVWRYWPFYDPPYPFKDPDGRDYDWADFLHSPDPKRVKNSITPYPYWNSPNFAYLMLKTAGYPSKITSKNKAYSLGWGGHIAADWVAHNKNLFPIADHNIIQDGVHLLGETNYDVYVYITRRSIPTKMRFNPSLIHKALMNYRLIALHEANLEWSDEKVTLEAKKSTLPKAYIQGRCKTFAERLAVIQGGYAATVVKLTLKGKLPIFLLKMRNAGAESNISLAENATYAWVNVRWPRGGIPNYDNLVIPFRPVNLLSAFASDGYQPSFYQAASLLHASALGEEESTDVTDEVYYGFWAELTNRVKEAGILQASEETTEEGELIVDVEITDQTRFEEIFEAFILECVSNPSSNIETKYAFFMRNIAIEGEGDIDKLMDMISPTITGLTPANGSFTNNTAPTISATVQDNEGGIGVDFEHIKIILDGEALETSFDVNTGQVSATPKGSLPEGEHSVSLVAFDKAGNEAEKTWKFTVDTIPPELTHDVINKIINVKKNTVAAIELISNEPITFRAEIFRVKDKQTGNKGEKVYTYTYQELTQEFTFFWGGRNDEGNLVPGGVYTVKITAADRAANETTFEAQVNVNNEAGK